MVRLVFRPYTQIRPTICTSVQSVPPRASARVSFGSTLFRHALPSFGPQQICSYSNLSQKILVGRRCTRNGIPPTSRSFRIQGLPPYCLHVLDAFWSVFQDGLVEAIVPASSGRRPGAPPCQPQLCNEHRNVQSRRERRGRKRETGRESGGREGGRGREREHPVLIRRSIPRFNILCPR